MEFCKLFFADQHTKVVGAYCPIIISRLIGKIHKAFYQKDFFFFKHPSFYLQKRMENL